VQEFRTISKIVVAAILFTISSAAADVPEYMNYQGRLTDETGNPLDTVIEMTFTLYRTPNGPDFVWSETQNSVSVVDGLFDVVFGSVNPLPDSVFADRFRWLGVSVGNRPEIFPRTRIVSVAYAMEAERADTADFAIAGGNVGDASWHTIDTVLFTRQAWGIARGGVNNALLGANAFTMTNLGVNCTTGVAGQDLFYSNVSGGYRNTAAGSYSAVGGGIYNHARGLFSTVFGGFQNYALGDNSIAAGSNARANHNGSFVWADSFTDSFPSMRNNQFRVRAHGGMRYDINNNRWIEIFDDGVGIITSSTGARLTVAGIWANASDRSLKEDFKEIDGADILDRISKLPISTWRNRVEADSVRHIGPMAQDFYRAFGYGDDDKTISTVDPAGVALAAIQELNRRTDEIAVLREQIKQLQAEVARLAAER
jgi:uncharacterized small protein (DUF1192 family)